MREIEMGLTGEGKSRMAGFGEEGCAAAEVKDEDAVPGHHDARGAAHECGD